MTSFPVPLPAEVKTRRFPVPWTSEDHNNLALRTEFCYPRSCIVTSDFPT